ncbi:hypothetical protein A6X21_21815 [Planctopirus hydrillae]|uniref:Uncharacterized protein n=1 Tax=Planctopirus hydrillae TaxID=1841610 RepID=A0A1C3EFB8_9PLAN|nr:hypothetical protein A6X21_21815 [Planctopirus hydrillae]
MFISDAAVNWWIQPSRKFHRNGKWQFCSGDQLSEWLRRKGMTFAMVQGIEVQGIEVQRIDSKRSQQTR